MKRQALSLKQPWAALLVSGRKSVEVRRWRTPFRGTVLIHAARVDDDRPEAWALVPSGVRPLAERRRGIIGEGDLYDCRPYPDLARFTADVALHRNDPAWFEERGLFGFCFRGLREVPFVPLPGFVRLFEVDWDEPEVPSVVGTGVLACPHREPTRPIPDAEPRPLLAGTGEDARSHELETTLPPLAVRGRLDKLMRKKDG